jgi:hypothetical protein
MALPTAPLESGISATECGSKGRVGPRRFDKTVRTESKAKASETVLSPLKTLR